MMFIRLRRTRALTLLLVLMLLAGVSLTQVERRAKAQTMPLPDRAAQFIYLLDESNVNSSALYHGGAPAVLNSLRFLRNYAQMFPESRRLRAAVIVFGERGAFVVKPSNATSDWIDLNSSTTDQFLVAGGGYEQALNQRCQQVGHCAQPTQQGSTQTNFIGLTISINQLLGQVWANTIPISTGIFLYGTGIDCPDGCDTSALINPDFLRERKQETTRLFGGLLTANLNMRIHLLQTRDVLMPQLLLSPDAFWRDSRTTVVSPADQPANLPPTQYFTERTLDLLTNALVDPADRPLAVQRVHVIGGNLHDAASDTSRGMIIPHNSRELRMLSVQTGSLEMGGEIAAGAVLAGNQVVDLNSYLGSAGFGVRRMPGTLLTGGNGFSYPSVTESWTLDSPPPGRYIFARPGAMQSIVGNVVLVQARPAEMPISVSVTSEHFQYYPFTVEVRFGSNPATGRAYRAPHLSDNPILADHPGVYDLHFFAQICADNMDVVGAPADCASSAAGQVELTTTDDGYLYRGTLVPIQQQGDAFVRVTVVNSASSPGGEATPVPIDTQIGTVHPITLSVDCNALQAYLASGSANVPVPTNVFLNFSLETTPGKTVPSDWYTHLAGIAWYPDLGGAVPSIPFDPNDTVHWSRAANRVYPSTHVQDIILFYGAIAAGERLGIQLSPTIAGQPIPIHPRNGDKDPRPRNPNQPDDTFWCQYLA